MGTLTDAGAGKKPYVPAGPALEKAHIPATLNSAPYAAAERRRGEAEVYADLGDEIDRLLDIYADLGRLAGRVDRLRDRVAVSVGRLKAEGMMGGEAA